MKIVVGALEGLGRISQVGGVIALAFMAITVTYDALMRYLFAAPTSWSLEINSFLVVYLALMTAADVERRREHIGITFLTDNLGPTGRRVISVVISVVGAAFCAILVWRGALMTHDAWTYGERVSSAFGTPTWIPYAMLPVGFGLLGLQFLVNMVRGRPASPDAQDGRGSDAGETTSAPL